MGGERPAPAVGGDSAPATVTETAPMAAVMARMSPFGARSDRISMPMSAAVVTPSGVPLM